jgi:spermidine/putrescine transport system permease protein
LLDKDGIINQALLLTGLISQPLPLLNSPFAIILGMLYCYLPFMILPIYAALERFDKTLLQASQDLGATQIETLIHIIIPLSLPAIVSGFLLVFIPSFGEFAIPGLLGGEKYLFVGSVIAQYALSANTLAYGTAFAVISLLCLLGFVFLAYVVKFLIAAYLVRNED